MSSTYGMLMRGCPNVMHTTLRLNSSGVMALKFHILAATEQASIPPKENPFKIKVVSATTYNLYAYTYLSKQSPTHLSAAQQKILLGSHPFASGYLNGNTLQIKANNGEILLTFLKCTFFTPDRYSWLTFECYIYQFPVFLTSY